MSKPTETNPQSKWILLRYGIMVLILIGLVGSCIIACIIKIAFVERDEWLTIAEKERKRVPDSIINPERGNIYACDGRLMATSFPLYHIYIDFRGKAIDSMAFRQIPVAEKKGQPITENDIEKARKNGIDSLSYYLAKKFKKDERTVKRDLKEAFDKKASRFKLTDTRISYADLKEIQEYPFFSLGANQSGRISEVFIERRKPYTSLASRTVGDVYAYLDSLGYSKGRNGLEMQYDSILRGEPGLKSRQRIGGRWIDVPIRKAVRGMDIQTTIDLDIQYAAEKALRSMMYHAQAQTGSVVVMAVKTGEIKAIANLGKTSTGDYEERGNYAVSDMIEPGSTFKTASIMVALEDGVCQPNDLIDTGNGVFRYTDNDINDHNKDKGGNHIITVEEAIYRSSNIGVAKIILKGYEKNPKKFVEGIYRLGLAEDLHLEIPGAGHPNIRMPNERNWYKSTLPWMSFGYETSIPPIYMLTFYNAIANNGKMMRPYFVEEIFKDGKTVQRFKPEVIRESICTSKTLRQIQNMLIGVVENEHGTGKPAYSSIVRIAGKTGTALIGEKGGYTGNGKQVSFAGYFPAENPEYSCIVVIRRPQAVIASGGGTAGRVVKEIAESIYTIRHPLDLRKVKNDLMTSSLPVPKAGDKQSLKKVLKKLDIDTERDDTKSSWVTASKSNNNNITLNEINVSDGVVPRVTGMGAKDALYLLENAGLRVRITGMGKTVSQSIAPGQKAVKGQTIVLVLK